MHDKDLVEVFLAAPLIGHASPRPNLQGQGPQTIPLPHKVILRQHPPHPHSATIIPLPLHLRQGRVPMPMVVIGNQKKTVPQCVVEGCSGIENSSDEKTEGGAGEVGVLCGVL